MDARKKSAEAVPAGDDDQTVYIVMVKTVSRWLPFTLANGEQAVATTIDAAESMLVEAKRHINKYSKPRQGKIAANGLRIFRSPADEL